MKELTLFTVDTPYRQPLSVKAWQFGNENKKSLAVVGALRGNEIHQMFTCSQLIQRLSALEAEGKLSPDAGILVIPCANQFSMNVGKRFWAADNTDINRMFPGYDQGETTQRIAERLFSAVQGYSYGVHLTTVYLPGSTMNNVRYMHTGYEEPELAFDFGLPYVVRREPQPYDTTTLNYNWQIWNTQAFSLYSPARQKVDPVSAEQMITAILRFLAARGLLDLSLPEPAAAPKLVQESSILSVHNTAGGVLLRDVSLGDRVSKGARLGHILDPLSGELLEELPAPCDGVVFYNHGSNLIAGREIAFRILPENP